jgi:hypothetical protein
MSSAETSKKERAEEKAPLPLKVTIEDPNTGDTVTIQPNFFVGLYTRRDENAPEGAVGVGQILKGAANVLEQIAIVKAMQEKAVPMILDQIDSHLEKEEKEAADDYTNRLGVLLSTLLLGSLFSDD